MTPYHATRNGKDAGTAYFDSHVVRTLPETLMVVVDPQGKVTRVEVLAFAEPEDYLPPGAWYGQFLGQGLSDDLALGHRIRSVTGASLTARATTEAVRRVLAIHQVLQARTGGEAVNRLPAWISHAATLLVGGTGLVYAWMRYLVHPADPFAVVNHPLQPLAQHLHILARAAAGLRRRPRMEPPRLGLLAQGDPAAPAERDLPPPHRWRRWWSPAT